MKNDIRIFRRGVREVRNGFRLVDIVWRKFNKGQDRFFVSLSKYAPGWLTPNLLSWLNIVLALRILTLLHQYTQWSSRIIIYFIVSIIADTFDGAIARAKDSATPKGAFLDGLGDKLLICPLVIRLVWGFDRWLVFMIVGLELLFAIIAILAVNRGVSTKANWFGKWKMRGQATGVLILFFFPEKTAIAGKVLWVALGLGLASLLGHFQSYVNNRRMGNNWRTG